MFACRETASHRNENFKKQKQQIHKKPGALRDKYDWTRWMTHQEGCHLFSIFMMENDSELRAAQSCHTCQKLHRWNVNDADGGLKMASNLRVQKGRWSKIPWGKVFPLNPPQCEWRSHRRHKQDATSTTSGYLLRQILPLCPPSSTTSTGGGRDSCQVWQGQQLYHPSPRALICPFNSTFVNEFMTSGSNSLLLLFALSLSFCFSPQPFSSFFFGNESLWREHSLQARVSMKHGVWGGN